VDRVGGEPPVLTASRDGRAGKVPVRSLVNTPLLTILRRQQLGRYLDRGCASGASLVVSTSRRRGEAVQTRGELLVPMVPLRMARGDRSWRA